MLEAGCVCCRCVDRWMSVFHSPSNADQLGYVCPRGPPPVDRQPWRIVHIMSNPSSCLSLSTSVIHVPCPSPRASRCVCPHRRDDTCKLVPVSAWVHASGSMGSGLRALRCESNNLADACWQMQHSAPSPAGKGNALRRAGASPWAVWARTRAHGTQGKEAGYDHELRTDPSSSEAALRAQSPAHQ